MGPRTYKLPPAGPEAMRAKISEAYARQSREDGQEKLILDHLPLVKHIVQRIAAQLSYRKDVDDLISAGTLGLVRAARAYDPGRNAEFKTYAYVRIRGAVIDELRGRSFAPARTHGQLRRIRQAYQTHRAAHGKPPEDTELAAEAGMTLTRLYKTLEEARKQHFLSIHGLSDDDPALGALTPRDPDPAPDEQVERKELLERLAAAIRELSKRDRLVILLYYERDLTMKEAAEVLGVTESRVSQLHASALFKLAMKLKGAA